MAIKREKIQPQGIHVSMVNGKARYTQVVTVSGTGKMIFVAGQLARNAQGVCVGKGDMRAQIQQVGIGSAAPEGDNVILPIAWARTACAPVRWAGTFPLELPRYLTRSVLLRSKRAGKGDRNRQHDNYPGARDMRLVLSDPNEQGCEDRGAEDDPERRLR